MPSIVRIADPRGSTPRPLSLIAVGVGGVVAGLLLVQLSLATARTDSPPDAPSEGDTGAALNADSDELALAAHAAHTVEADELTQDEELTETPDVDAEADEAPTDATAALDEPSEPSDAPAAAPATEGGANAEATAPAPGDVSGAARTLDRGRVAYFQCPNDSCARDHDLERAVFQALERSTGCMGGLGDGDVRVTMTGGAVTDVRFRERGTGGLDIGVLDRCLSPPLRRVGGSALSDGVVVSFRFDVH